MGIEGSKQINTSSVVEGEGAFAEVRGWCVLPPKDNLYSLWGLSWEAQNNFWWRPVESVGHRLHVKALPEGNNSREKMAIENMLGLSAVTISNFPGLSVWEKQTFPDCRSWKLIIDSGYCAGRCQAGLFSFSSSDEIE